VDEQKLAELYPGAKFIKLTQGQWAIVDEEDFERINMLRWHASSRNGKFYASHWLTTNSRTKKLVGMHRMIVCAPIHKEVDHKNHNGLDNRKTNLRICSQLQNEKNKPRYSNNASGFKGVVLRNGAIISQITADTKVVYLGTFATLETAAEAYDSAALRYFGEFACTNKMLGLL
jgi:hypothetical protein